MRRVESPAVDPSSECRQSFLRARTCGRQSREVGGRVRVRELEERACGIAYACGGASAELNP